MKKSNNKYYQLSFDSIGIFYFNEDGIKTYLEEFPKTKTLKQGCNHISRIESFGWLAILAFSILAWVVILFALFIGWGV